MDIMRYKEILLKTIEKKGAAIVLGILVLIGFLLRVYALSHDSLWIDEGYTIMQQRAVSAHGYPLLMSGYLEIKDLFLPYVLAVINEIFGFNIFAFRFVSVVAGTFSIVLLYAIGKELANRYIGLVASFFMTFSYWHIAWSRQIRAYSLFVMLILLAMYYLVKYENKNKNRYIYCASFAIGLAILAKSNAGILLLPGFVLYMLIKKRYPMVFAGLTGILLLTIFFKKTLLDATSLSLVNYFAYYTVGYYWQYFGIIFVIAIIGFYFAIKYHKKYLHIHLFNILYFIIPLIFFSFFSYVNQKRYLFFTTPFLFIYAAYFVFYFTKDLIFDLKKKKSFVLIIILSSVIVFDSVHAKSMMLFPNKTYSLESYTPQPNFKKAYNELAKRINEEDVIVSAYPYMDLMYLNRFNYALEVSYTGLRQDSSLHGRNEFYTNAPALLTVEELIEVRKKSHVYIILDVMGINRMNHEISAYIRKEATIMMEERGADGQGIIVYDLSIVKI